VSQALDLVNDCFRFVTGFFEVISTSSPHIYHSALPLSPRESLVRGLYESHTCPLARIVHGLPTSWDQSTATVWFVNNVDAAAWSPCSRFVAISRGGHPPTVEILDAATLARLTILDFPTGDLGSGHQLIFSPDGRLLTWFGSVPGERARWDLISWDLQTGVLASAISAEEGRHYNPITYSLCGTMFGVLIYSSNNPVIYSFDDATIHTYNALSGTRICSHPVIKVLVGGGIWTHGERIRFATKTSRSITIWEAGFASTHAPTKVGTLSIPRGYGHADFLLAHPTLPRPALVFPRRVSVWDSRNSRFLLDSWEVVNDTRNASFSPDGRFFACNIRTSEGDISLWRESHTGYVLYQNLISKFGATRPLFSPNGGSVVAFGSSAVQLWHIIDSTTPLATHTDIIQRRIDDDFILRFSPNETLAAVMRKEGETITVLDLKSGISQLIIKAYLKVYGLGVTGSSIVAVRDKEVMTWNLPTEDHIPNLEVDFTDSIRIPMIDHDGHGIRLSGSGISVSPDLHHIAVAKAVTDDDGNPMSNLWLYGVSTGQHLGTVTADRNQSGSLTPWFTPDGREVWCVGDDGEVDRWELVEDSKSDIIKLERLGSTDHRPDGFPWQSSRGYQLMDGRWILSPGGKRLFWLPPQWRSDERQRMWGRRFLALLPGQLPEAVILELE